MVGWYLSYKQGVPYLRVPYLGKGTSPVGGVPHLERGGPLLVRGMKYVTLVGRRGTSSRGYVTGGDRGYVFSVGGVRLRKCTLPILNVVPYLIESTSLGLTET